MPGPGSAAAGAQHPVARARHGPGARSAAVGPTRRTVQVCPGRAAAQPPPDPAGPVATEGGSRDAARAAGGPTERKRCELDRCVVLVDAGYLLGAAASLLAGEPARARIA